MNHQGISETLLKMSLIKSHWNSICDKQHMPTLFNHLRVGALNQEIFLKDISMAIPQLNRKEIFLMHMKIICGPKKLITK